MSFISLLGAIASNINASNISEFVQLTENLVGIGESLVSEIESIVKKPIAPVVSAVQPSNSSPSN